MNSLYGITAWLHLCPTYQLCCHGKHDELLLTYFCAARRTPAGTLSSVLNAHRQKHQRHCNVSIKPPPHYHHHRCSHKVLDVWHGSSLLWYTLRDSTRTHTLGYCADTHTCQSSSYHTTIVSVVWQAFVGELTAMGAS